MSTEETLSADSGQGKEPGNSLELFLHSATAEAPVVIEVEGTVTIRELLEEHGEEGEGVWAEDAEEILQLEVTLVTAGIQHRHHLHHNHCRRVDVVAWDGGGHDVEKNFAPAQTVIRVLDWALGKDGFNIPEPDWANYEFRTCGGDHAIPLWVHVGSLVTAGTCGVCLELVKKHNPQG